MSNQLIFGFLVAMLLIVFISYKTRQSVLMKQPFGNMEKELKEAIELSTQLQAKDSNLSNEDREVLQAKVNNILKTVEQNAMAMDKQKDSYNNKVDKVNPQKYKVELDALLHMILNKWKEHNLTLRPIAEKQLYHHYKQIANMGFPKDFIEDINKAIVKTRPSLGVPMWLKEIDNFFAQEHSNHTKYSRLLSSQYNTLLMLSLPLVSFEQIIQLKSFDDLVVMYHHFNSVDIPRDLNETKRLYETILKLPKKYVLYSLYGKQESSQPFKAQMFMVTLMKNPHKDEDVHSYLKEIISSAPTYLFDYPNRNGAADVAHSFLPAQNMVYQNPSLLLNKLIYKRSTEVFQKEFDNYLAYREKEEKLKAIISTTLPEDNRSITQRVSKEQMEFAKQLKSLDGILKEHNLTLPPPLNDEQIEKLEKYLLPFKLPQEYITLYKWHNGMDDSLFMYLPIEKALYEYKELETIVSYYEDKWWTKNLFPLNAFNGDTYWLLDLNNSNSSAISYIFLEGGDLEDEYSSISKMIEVYIEAFKKKIILYNDKEGDMEIDEDEFTKLRKVL